MPAILSSALLRQFALVLCWSAGFVGYRYAADQAPTLLVTFWRFALAALLLLPFAWTELRRLPLRIIGQQAAIGALAFAGCIAPSAKAIELGVSPGLAALLSDLSPLLVALGCCLLPGQRTSGRQWLGLGLGLTGVLLATGAGLGLGVAPGWAYVLPLGGALALALATLVQSRLPPSNLALPTQLFIQLAASSLVMTMAAGLEGPLRPPLTPGFALAVLWLLIPTLLGYGLYWLCLRQGSPQAVSGALYLSPPVALLWAWACFDEPLAPGMLLGLLFALAGLLCLNAAERDADRGQAVQASCGQQP
ncbi:DMT family transporter [Pseudomonas oryzihabitans]|uniref:Drug/metabolite transporter (DMT)-like permease n=1 Tax=Pseudomonas oryzihabitans TaxID=47885 RepID=A0AAJ2EV34_9PSED|nr:DMT family transporter [Pseudomonas psychrotolerans]MDR6233368.1 drug/metabolite transporter (DMT)-like permease [Pseudomonas psychrotolerans]MDR6357607.1 drug/metabolite transporter (DMT)-like permease [Pseudomonas psychrotolerans]